MYHNFCAAFLFKTYATQKYTQKSQKPNSVYGHFGPRTLRTQDTSALVPKCPLDTSAPTKNSETLRH